MSTIVQHIFQAMCKCTFVRWAIFWETRKFDFRSM